MVKVAHFTIFFLWMIIYTGRKLFLYVISESEIVGFMILL